MDHIVWTKVRVQKKFPVLVRSDLPPSRKLENRWQKSAENSRKSRENQARFQKLENRPSVGDPPPKNWKIPVFFLTLPLLLRYSAALHILASKSKKQCVFVRFLTLENHSSARRVMAMRAAQLWGISVENTVRIVRSYRISNRNHNALIAITPCEELLFSHCSNANKLAMGK